MMNTGAYYIKRRINPIQMNLYGKQNMMHYKLGQPLKNMNNILNYSSQEEEKGLYNIKQNNGYFNNQSIINQNIQYSNINNNVTNLKQYGTKILYRNNNIYPINNDYFATYNIPQNNTNNIIYNNNNPYNINKINGMQINNNNNNYINPYSNQPIINKIPVMNIQIKPKIIPIKKNIIHKLYPSPKKIIIKKDINIQPETQRFATISNKDDNKDNNLINEFNKDNINNIEKNPFLINNNNNSNNINRLKRINFPKNYSNIVNNNSDDLNALTNRITISPKLDNIDILNQDINEIPTRIRSNNITDILDYPFNSIDPYLNQIISTPTKKNISPQKQENDIELENEHNQSLRLTQTFHNYIDNNQEDDFITTPIKNPFNSNSNNQTPNKQINNNIYKKGNSIKSVHYLCRPGSEEDGSIKTNQDTYLALSNVNNNKNFSIFAVLDGHGPHGHLISKYASQSISQKIINHPSIKSIQNIDNIYINLKKNNFEIIKQAFISTDNQLKINSTFDVEDSGTTCVLVIIIGSHLICANVGDSRAIVVYDENNDSNLSYLKIVPLSIDFKPDIPEEKNRIINSGGIVDQIKNYRGIGTGPMRVFSPGKNSPGLAMSRSIGDTIAKKLGVIAEPDIIEYELNEKSKFVIMCSDGIWEFLNNEQVKNLGRKFYINNDSSGLCEELYSNALIEWQCNDSIVDDITVISIFFN